MNDASRDALDVALKVFEPETGLESEGLAASAEVLTRLLADSQLVLQKTLGVHWSVAGPAFASLHQLTENQYKALFEAIDEIAERIRALGRPAPSMASQYARTADLSEARAEDASVADMVRMLIGDHEAICRTMREAVEPCEDRRDYVTADMLVERMAFHEKAVWMLRATAAA